MRNQFERFCGAHFHLDPGLHKVPTIHVCERCADCNHGCWNWSVKVATSGARLGRVPAGSIRLVCLLSARYKP